MTLNYASYLPADHPEMISFKKGFVDKAVGLSMGKLAFNFRGGPETIPPGDLIKATQGGMVDFSCNMAEMVEPLIPLAGATILSRISVDEERKNGTYAYMDELSRKATIHYMGRFTPAGDAQYFNLFLNKKIEKQSDFKGTKIGTIPSLRGFTSGWGATPVFLSTTDFYTAMERGTVDGISASTLSNWTLLGAQAVTKYVVLPGYLQSSTYIGMNLNTWNKLGPELQQVINDAMINSEKENIALYITDKERGSQKLKTAKLEIYSLAPDVAKWFLDAGYDAAWSAYMTKSPGETPKLKQLLSGGK
jgi:TRAP-type C4-dicarboxylate transport system substrate-binding protein